jgi:hypothetical protein
MKHTIEMSIPKRRQVSEDNEIKELNIEIIPLIVIDRGFKSKVQGPRQVRKPLTSPELTE